jgi:hypothetical protein
VTIFAGVAFLIALIFLPVLELSVSVSYWDIDTSTSIVLVAVASASVCLALLGLLRGGALAPVLATACAAYLFGKVFSVRDFGSGYASGYWTMASASLVMAIGGVLASVGRA